MEKSYRIKPSETAMNEHKKSTVHRSQTQIQGHKAVFCLIRKRTEIRENTMHINSKVNRF